MKLKILAMICLLGFVNGVVYGSEENVTTAMLDKFVNSDKKVGWKTMCSYAEFIGKSEKQIIGAEDVLLKIINSATNDYTLKEVARAIKRSKTPIIGAGVILSKIVNSDKAGSGTLSAVAYAIGDSETPIVGAEAMLLKMINSDNADGDLLNAVRIAIHNSKTPIVGAEAMLLKIENHPKLHDSLIVSTVDSDKREKLLKFYKSECSEITEQYVICNGIKYSNGSKYSFKIENPPKLHDSLIVSTVDSDKREQLLKFYKSECSEITEQYVICNGSKYVLDRTNIDSLKRDGKKLENYIDDINNSGSKGVSK